MSCCKVSQGELPPKSGTATRVDENQSEFQVTLGIATKLGLQRNRAAACRSCNCQYGTGDDYFAGYHLCMSKIISSRYPCSMVKKIPHKILKNFHIKSFFQQLFSKDENT
ncbi:hypothetical protein NPIL_620851 [Nephila pilipes]|uniref:Uncharacterized protein n=1 Tax=Nephila pilipes TaxID=299642 RepID=A0A8X6UEU6_NEPPI|nr:hypothetical protein NPIL_620851 [Nephila pilipes]